MLGSGLCVINPPWVLKDILNTILPYLVDALAQYPDARYELS
jgi:23S rRNA (adenine2030-N6)-methyltransferase